tara:strand:+ start:158 stop:664 length:507 start_codon:yes stop_codon:yes gene_type:complete
LRISLIIILFLFCTYTFADFNAQVVRVIDGDTIQVKDNLGHKFKIRLLGIDTPEIKQAFGKESSDYLKSIVTGKKILIISKPDNDKPYTLDFYKRVLAKVILNGKDINLEMVKKGMAWHYKKYKNNQPFDDQQSYNYAESEARKKNIGLWVEKDPLPPWSWRKINRRR